MPPIVITPAAALWSCAITSSSDWAKISLHSVEDARTPAVRPVEHGSNQGTVAHHGPRISCRLIAQGPPVRASPHRYCPAGGEGKTPESISLLLTGSSATFPTVSSRERHVTTSSRPRPKMFMNAGMASPLLLREGDVAKKSSLSLLGTGGVKNRRIVTALRERWLPHRLPHGIGTAGKCWRVYRLSTSTAGALLSELRPDV